MLCNITSLLPTFQVFIYVLSMLDALQMPTLRTFAMPLAMISHLGIVFRDSTSVAYADGTPVCRTSLRNGGNDVLM